MKKILLALLLMTVMSGMSVMGIGEGAPDFEIFYRDSLSDADTVTNAERTDTTYSEIRKIDGHHITFWLGMFHYNLQGTFNAADANGDTNFVNDSFFVNFQHSYNQVDWLTVELDTLLDTAYSAYPLDVLDRSTQTIGKYGRMMLIHYDKWEASSGDAADSTYTFLLKAWMYQTGKR